MKKNTKAWKRNMKLSEVVKKGFEREIGELEDSISILSEDIKKLKDELKTETLKCS